MQPELQCARCVHFDRASQSVGTYRCEAFPRGIPTKILVADHDHREPYPGDRGIRFELAAEFQPLRPA